MGSGASTHAGSEAKVSGDSAFKAGDFPEAILWWTQAILGHAEEPLSPRELALLYSNRSMGHFKVGAFESALADGLEAIEQDPQWFKGYYNASKALTALGRGLEAVSVLGRAVALSGDAASLQEELEALQREHAIQLRAYQGCTLSWGVAQTGALGRAAARDCEVPAMVDALRGKHVVDASCGAMHCVAVTGLGEVYAWGNNKYGQTGHGGGAEQVVLPRIVSGLVGVSVCAVSCGGGHTVVTAADGRVFSWGLGSHGQLGLGGTDPAPAPRQVTALGAQQVSAVAAGIAHTLFLLAGGGVAACGMNTYGALGLDTGGSPVLSPRPVRIESRDGCPVPVAHIAAGGAHTMLVSTDGDIYGAGSNSCGQLGLGAGLEDCAQFRPVCGGAAEGRAFSFVSCGEEFSVAVSRDRLVFSCGLGIGGQLGHGSTDNLCSFARIAALDGCGIETVACSQGAVFALSAAGTVHTWGTQLHFAAAAGGGAEASSRPSLSGVFSKRRKARHISCGRKHYLLLAFAPFGPASGIVPGSCRPCDLPSEEDKTIVAGTALRCTIQTMDVLGAAVEFGGAALVGSAVRRPEAYLSDSAAEGPGHSRFNPPSVTVDDNLDGTYAATILLKSIGVYDISFCLDELHIQDSPSCVTVVPASPHAPSCRLLAAAVRRDANEDRVHCCSSAVVPTSAVIANCGEPSEPDRLLVSAQSGDSVLLYIQVSDKYGNAISAVPEDTELAICCCSARGGSAGAPYRAVLNLSDAKPEAQCSNDRGAASGLYSACFPAPEVADTYDVAVSIGQTEVGTCRVDVVARGICSARSVVSAPSDGNVDDDYVVRVRPFTKSGDPIVMPPPADSGDRSLIRSMVRPLQCSVSARAMVHLGCVRNGGSNIYGKSVWQEREGCILLSHAVRFAGEAELTVWIGDTVVAQANIMIYPGVVSPKFSEVINPRVSIAAWCPDDEPCRRINLQSRDSFGNLITSGAGAVCSSLIVIEGGRCIRKEKLEVTYIGDGLYEIAVNDRDRGESGLSYELAISINGEDILYSPFALSDANLLGSGEEKQAQTKIAEDFGMELKKVVVDHDAKKRMVDITRLRAMERLKREQLRLREEKNERKRQKAVKRTGGGFIIQYSKDI